MRWNYIHIDTREIMMLSGYKLYIYGNTINQGKIAASLLSHIIIKYNLTTKICTEEIIKRNLNRRIPWSSMVIYLTKEGMDSFNSILLEIISSLESYPYTGKYMEPRILLARFILDMILRYLLKI